jgi:obscurin-RhoGEF protein
MPLQEQTECIEGDTVTLVCEVNKPNKPAMWLRDGEQIVPGDGVEITVDGNIHKLLIRRASLDSEAEYTCMIGNVDTTTMLYVEGKVNIPYFHNYFPLRTDKWYLILLCSTV